jgi:hypothetical protein
MTVTVSVSEQKAATRLRLKFHFSVLIRVTSVERLPYHQWRRYSTLTPILHPFLLVIKIDRWRCNIHATRFLFHSPSILQLPISPSLSIFTCFLYTVTVTITIICLQYFSITVTYHPHKPREQESRCQLYPSRQYLLINDHRTKC